MYVGPQGVPTWLRSTREASRFGVERSSSRFKGLVTRECSLLTSRPVKGMEYDIGLGQGIKSMKRTHSGCYAFKSHVVGVFCSSLPLEVLLFMHKSFLE